MNRLTGTDIPAARRGWRLFLKVKKDPLAYFTRLMNETGAYAWLGIDGCRVLMLNDATGIEHVLQNNSRNFIKGHFQHVTEPVFGTSIIMQEGEGWRQRRQMAAPAFSNGRFQDFIDRMQPAIAAMCRRIDDCSARDLPVDVGVEMTRFTLDALLRALFHEQDDNRAYGVRESLGIILQDIEARLWSPVKLPTIIATRLPGYNKAFAFLKEIVVQLLAKRQAGQSYPEDLLSRIIGHFGSSAAEQSMLFDEALSYLLAGHETTAHTLAWSLYTLTRYPSLKQKFEAEACAKVSPEQPRFEEILSLAFGRNFLSEVMRLYPPVWTMSREAVQPDDIPLDDYSTVPVAAGDTIMLCQYAVHRREQYWPNPEGFDPDRFADDSTQAELKYKWFPFGAGPRICIGARFAQTETLMALALLLQRYDFSLVAGQDIRPEPMITLRPQGPILIKFRRRKSALQPGSLNITDQAPAACPYHHLLGQLPV